MLQSDAHIDDLSHFNQRSSDRTISNINSITIDVMTQIDKELAPYDLISMMFLLHDSPDASLEQLKIFHRIRGEKDMNLLRDWAQKTQSRVTWKEEFLEALAICQLYNVIRKLGFQPSEIKKHYRPNNIQLCVHINPMKKALYKLCENITNDNFTKFQNTLKTYDIDTSEYEQCELIVLKLMCQKFITVPTANGGKMLNQNYEIEKLAKILDNFSELKQFAVELRQIEKKYNNDPQPGPTSTSTPTKIVTRDNVKDDNDDYKYTASAFEDLYKHLNQLNIEENVQNLKSDTKKVIDGAYPIKNYKRIGVCYIINQVDFHPSKESIEGKYASVSLDRRLGSNRDKVTLENTMSVLNFEVISHRNLDHKKMMDFIKNIIENRVHHDDSIFMLCILSHGVKGHVYAADSVKVKIEDIQNLLDDGFKERQLYDVPKIMILQACQVENDDHISVTPTLVADSPVKYFMPKSHFLIYWATAPALEAYRDENKGSIFIQLLCHLIKEYASREHVYDIFTKVNDGVARICTTYKRNQIPIFESTLRKKLFFQIPD